MALQQGDKVNFGTLQRAMAAGDVCVVESRCAKTGEYRALICAVTRDKGEYQFAPLAQMITGNPYEDYVDPTSATLPEAN
jgi:hypothetical protein